MSGAPAISRWKVGAATISAVLESEDAFTSEFLRRHVLPGATAEVVRAMPWLKPAWVDDDDGLRFVTQAFLIVSEGQRILVDTCLGNDKPRKNPAFDRLQLPFLARLEAAGARPEDVDVVLCTHLHFDHVGWNTRWDGARWVPTFPRARYLFAKAEWAHWEAHKGHAYVREDSLDPLFEAGLVDLVEADHRVTGEVALVPTPGHTPGHVAVRVRSGDAEALITGDFIHHPVQVGRPELGSPADTDGAQAVETRRRCLDDARARGVALFGTHFAAPAAGHVRRGDDGDRLDPWTPDPD